VAAREETLAQVYATALLDLAFQKGVHAETLAELRAFAQILDKDPRFASFLNTPNVSREVKKDLLGRVFGRQVSDYTLNFLKVVVDKRRQGALPAIIAAFVEGYHQRMGEVVVQVTSATPLDGGQRNRLSAALKKKFDKDIILDEKVDPRLLGGLVMRSGDIRIDGSLRTRLEAIGARLAATRLRSQDLYEDQG
jgi:F-type H+-transporting ATPase subunit delta